MQLQTPVTPVVAADIDIGIDFEIDPDLDIGIDFEIDPDLDIDFDSYRYT